MSETHQPQDPKPSDNQPAIPGAIESLDKIPDELKPFYGLDEKSGKYIARVNGYYVPSSRLVEFRENNNEFKRQIADNEAAMAIYRSLNEDPKALEAEVLEARKIKQRLTDNELVDKKGFETHLAQRTEQMKQDLEGKVRALTGQVASLTAERDNAVSENKRIVVHGELTKAAITAGILPEGIPDLLFRADRSGWTRNEKGEPVLLDPKTNSYVYGPNAVDNITPEEWVLSQKQGPARHLFNQPYGGGATGSDSYSPGKNPWSKDAWNETEQAKTYLADPTKAKQMAEQAGTRLGALRPA